MAKKLPSKAQMMKREKHETRAQERAESPAYQKREEKLGVEMHKLGKKVANQPFGQR